MQIENETLLLLVQPETRGSVNGINQSLVAISRSIAPLVGSLVFAWSENSGRFSFPQLSSLSPTSSLSSSPSFSFYFPSHFFPSGYGWPLDYHFVFNMVAVLSLGLIFISLLLPKSIEKKRQRPAAVAT